MRIRINRCAATGASIAWMAVLATGCASSSMDESLFDEAGRHVSSDASSSGASSSGASSSGASSSGASSSGASSSGASSSGASSSGASSSGASSSGVPVVGDDAGAVDSGWAAPVDGGPSFSGPVVPGAVTVNRAMSAGQIGQGFLGFSFEKTHISNGSLAATNGPLVALFNLLGPTVIRLGANDVDKCTWVPATPAGRGGPPFSRSIGTAMVDDLAAFLTATGSRIIYGLNYNSGTPANDAAEATYVATKLGSSLYGFEIGNEINRFGTWPTTLKSNWDAIAAAILAANPNARFVGPAGGGGNQTALSTPFAADEASKNLVLLTQHYYAGTATTPTATLAKLLVPDPFPVTSSQGLIEMLQVMNTAATANRIPDGFRDGECNTFSHHGEPGLSDALISALWSLDFLFTNAKYGASGVNFHGGEAGMDGSTPFIYSAIGELDGGVTGAKPLFYGMLLFSLAGNGKALATTATAGSLAFTAYGIARTDGSTSVVLVNKDTMSGVTATVDVGMAVSSASAIYLQGPTPVSLNATSGITLGGAGISAMGTWAPKPPFAVSSSGHSVTLLVPPASAALVRVQ